MVLSGLIYIDILGGAENTFHGHNRLNVFLTAAAAFGMVVTVTWKFPLGSVYTKTQLKDAADILLVDNLTNWYDARQALQNVIGGDHFYCRVCEALFMKKFNVLLVYVPNNVEYALLRIFKKNTPEGFDEDNTSMFLHQPKS